MKKADFDKLRQTTEAKLDFDATNIQSKISEVPRLQATFLRILTVEKQELLKLKSKLDTSYSSRLEYYKFNYQYRFDNKDELNSMIEGDVTFIQVQEEYNEQAIIVEYLEQVLKLISSLSFHHKNFIAQQNFLVGNYTT